MTDAPDAYPLAWPHGKARTPWQSRKRGKFTADGRSISRVYAIGRIERELGMLGGRYLIVSSDLPLRKDGQSHLGKGEPTDPGACIYFQLKGKPYAMACDTFDQLAQNLAAIAGHIEATRRIERYGVASAAETLTVFEALPAPKRPHEILGVAKDADQLTVQRAWRARIAQAHPDQGGSESAAAEINAARDAMLRKTA